MDEVVIITDKGHSSAVMIKKKLFMPVGGLLTGKYGEKETIERMGVCLH